MQLCSSSPFAAWLLDRRLQRAATFNVVTDNTSGKDIVVIDNIIALTGLAPCSRATQLNHAQTSRGRSRINIDAGAFGREVDFSVLQGDETALLTLSLTASKRC